MASVEQPRPGGGTRLALRQVNRRRFLVGLGLAGLDVGALATAVAACTHRSGPDTAPAAFEPAHDHRPPLSAPDGRSATALVAAKFTREMPRLRPARPDVVDEDGVDTFDVRAGVGHAQIVPGTDTPTWVYDGVLPGRYLRVRRDRPVRLRYRNDLPHPSVLHLHGGHVDAASDGYPMDVVEAGASRRYTFANRQPAATLWYHEHAHGVEAEGLYRGMSAPYVIEDPDEDELGLPTGAQDVAIVLTDVRVLVGGELDFSELDLPPRRTLCANGVAFPTVTVQARRYRLRFVNASNDRPYALALADGRTMVAVASDQGLLPASVPLETLVLQPSERAEVIIDFTDAPGRSIVLETRVNAGEGDDQVLRFDVTPATGPDRSRVPTVLTGLPAARAEGVERSWVLDFDPATRNHLINGRPFSASRIDARPELGTSETWTIRSPADRFNSEHVFHLHGFPVRVIDRDGRPPGPLEAGYKDAVALEPGETVRLAVAFTDYVGRFVLHCHLMGHARMMMSTIEVVA